MGIGKIIFGIAIIVIGITIWFSMFSDALNIFIESPQERYDFRQSLEKVQAIYFLVIILAGVGLVLWGAQT
jgi:amino acid transporter